MKIEKILVLLGRTQYDVLIRFAEKIVQGFQDLGIKVDIIDARESMVFDIRKYNTEYDLFFSFNGMGDYSLLEEIIDNDNIMTWRFFVDHPLYHDLRLLNGHRNTIMSFIDRNHVSYVKRMYTNTPYVYFMPHAGELMDNNVPFDQRRHNISFFGSYGTCDSYYSSIEKYDENMKKLIATIAERLYVETSNSMEYILDEELRNRGIVLTKEEFRATMAELDFVYDYVRNRKRHKVINTLLSAGYKVDVFGNGWENFESDSKYNLCMHGQVDYITAMNEMANSKIVLNVMPLYADGSHERVFTVMGLKTIIITDASAYLEEEFVNNKHLFYYSMESIDKLPDIVFDILNNNIDVSAIQAEAYNLVSQKHLWQHRAYEIVKYCEDILVSEQNSIEEHTTTDHKFNKLISFVKQYDINCIYEKMKDYCLFQSKINPVYMEDLINVWSSSKSMHYFNPYEYKFDVVKERALLLKNDCDDFVWAYNNLNDTVSKDIFLRILQNWVTLDPMYLKKYAIRDENVDLFDINLIKYSDEDVFVDLGVDEEETVYEYLKASRSHFKRIYCYEAEPEKYKILDERIQNLCDDRIVIKNGNGEETKVNIDGDINEKITLIKCDIEGGNYDVLLSAKTHIQNNHPTMSITISHGNKEIISVMKLINTMNNTYKFFIRYYGGFLYPSDIVLYAV